MRRILTLAVIPAISFSLSAQGAGRIQGKVTDKSGKPIAKATITLKRVGINWSKDVKSDAKGFYLLGGMEPKEYEISFSAEGYVTSKLTDRIPVGEALNRDVTLLTPEQAREESLKNNPNAAVIAGQAAEEAGVKNFNSALILYNNQNYTEALPLLESSLKAYQESLDKTKDEKTRATMETSMVTVQRVYGVTLFEVGKADETKKAESWKKADSLLTPILPKIVETDVPARLRIAKSLMEIAKDKKDDAAAAQYQAIVDKLEPPNPAKDYNQAVEAFNAGNYSDAKVSLDRTLRKDPNFAKAYYLLGMVEYGNNNLKATKAALQKYLELAPNGDKASDVKAMLEDPSLKRIK